MTPEKQIELSFLVSMLIAKLELENKNEIDLTNLSSDRFIKML